jgi:hypothetical protein
MLFGELGSFVLFSSRRFFLASFKASFTISLFLHFSLLSGVCGTPGGGEEGCREHIPLKASGQYIISSSDYPNDTIMPLALS